MSCECGGLMRQLEFNGFEENEEFQSYQNASSSFLGTQSDGIQC